MGISEIHDLFFNRDVPMPSSQVILSVYNENKALISDYIQAKQGFNYESAIRIKCEYCFALVETKQYRTAISEIRTSMLLIENLYDSADGAFNNAFYEKLLFGIGSSFYYLKSFKEALPYFEKLLKYFPNNPAYPNWIEAVHKGIRSEKGLLQLLFSKR